MAEINTTFSSHAGLTTAHIIPALLFVCLAVVVLFRAHNSRWIQGLFFLLGAITGITAYAMSIYSIGGWVERSAVLVFDTWFLVSLSCAFRCYLRDEPAKQREWTCRSVAILLGIATTRPVMGFFFATRGLSHLSPRQFFGVAFWIGFAVNALIIELWLHSERRAKSENLRLLPTSRAAAP